MAAAIHGFDMDDNPLVRGHGTRRVSRAVFRTGPDCGG